MIGPRCGAACREHPSCALAATGDYLVEAVDAVEDEVESAYLLKGADAFDHLAAAVQLMDQAVAVVNRRVIELHHLGSNPGCLLVLTECWAHPLCVSMAVEARVRATGAIVVVTIEDAASQFRLLNPQALTVLQELRRWVAERLEVQALEASLALPEASP